MAISPPLGLCVFPEVPLVTTPPPDIPNVFEGSFFIFCNSKLQAILPTAEILEAMEMDMILFVLLQTT